MDQFDDPSGAAAPRAGTDIAGLIACEFGAVDALVEARWIQECHDRTGMPDGFIAAVDLASPEIATQLAHYAERPIVRAVRQPMYWSDDPLTRLGARPDYLVDPGRLRGFEHVADSGFVWDLLLYADQLPQALPLLDRFPTVPIVLEAAGWPRDRSPDGFQRWREHLTALSEHGNVSLKLQGLALIFGPDVESLAPWVTSAVDIFGAGRCMFATHLPIDRLLWTAAALISAVGTALTGLEPLARIGFQAGRPR